MLRLEAGAESVRKAIDGAEEVTPEPPRPLMRELPPADPFPIDSLGDLLAPAAIAIHDRIQAPLAICGQSVIAAATLTVQGHADVELPTHQTRPLTNYYMSIAATGERKTAVDEEALWPIRKRETALREHWEARSSRIMRMRNLHGTRRAKPLRERRKVIAPASSLNSMRSAQHRRRP
jgi:hypothetical protein